MGLFIGSERRELRELLTKLPNINDQGVLPVIAIGNEGPGTSRSPGNYPEVLSVGAIDRSRRVAAFSGSMRFNREFEPNVPKETAYGPSPG